MSDIEEQRKLSLEFMVHLANFFHLIDVPSRASIMVAVSQLVEALDQFPVEAEAEAIYSPDSDRLIVAFGDPERAPIILDLTCDAREGSGVG